MKCNETLDKWCKNKHGASKIIDTLETYHLASKLFLFAAPLLGMGDEMSGDDGASVVPLTVGHVLLGEWRCS
jgi:hypothetical protein